MMLMALGGSQLHPVLGKHVGLGGEQDAQAGARVEDAYQARFGLNSSSL